MLIRFPISWASFGARSAWKRTEPLQLTTAGTAFDLAYEAGINRSYMSKLEKGASYPGLEIIAKLATVLEVEPAELVRVRVRDAKPNGF